jgi:hypothetical protein
VTFEADFFIFKNKDCAPVNYHYFHRNNMNKVLVAIALLAAYALAAQTSVTILADDYVRALLVLF